MGCHTPLRNNRKLIHKMKIAALIILTASMACAQTNHMSQLELMARTGNPAAQFAHAKMLFDSDDASKYKEAETWLTSAASQGIVEAQLYLGDRLMSLPSAVQGQQPAIYWLGLASDKNSLRATRLLGDYYRNKGLTLGGRINTHLDRAYSYYQKGASMGDTKCMVSLGTMLAQGETGAVNVDQALQWFERGGDYSEMARIYTEKRNYAEAYKWTRVAGRASGHSDIQSNLGAMGHLSEQQIAGLDQWADSYRFVGVAPLYQEPVPVHVCTPEEIEAAKFKAAKKKIETDAKTLIWHQELATKGDAYGQYKMGLRYLNGDGVEMDTDKARAMFASAAKQGNKDASTELAKLPLPAEKPKLPLTAEK